MRVMGGEIRIRAARVEDRDFVVGMVPSLLEFGSPAWRNPQALVPGYSSVLERALTTPDPDTGFLIAEGREGLPLGFISLKVRAAVGGADRAHVADLAVASSARGVGVGTALMSAAESWARERGLGTISLDVWAPNDRALSFYRRLGYLPESLHLIRELG